LFTDSFGYQPEHILIYLVEVEKKILIQFWYRTLVLNFLENLKKIAILIVGFFMKIYQFFGFFEIVKIDGSLILNFFLKN